MTDKEDAPLRTQDVKAVLVAKQKYIIESHYGMRKQNEV